MSAADERLERLESRLMLLEDQADAFDAAIYRQQRQIGQLQEAVRELARQLRAAQNQRGDVPLRPEDEIPPHW
jgi:uncharacterized coiled-coil protein SlyX